MRRILTIVGLAVVCLGLAGSALGADPAPATTGPDGYVAPVCGELADLSTLAGVDCAGTDGVPSLDPADEANPPTVESLSAAAAIRAAAEPSPDVLRAYCREHVNVYFYTSSDWVRLGQKLAADASPCADYYISIPPLAADKTGLRCAQDDLIRAIGPRIHPMVEFHFAGWNAWWKANNKGPVEAAQAFLKKVYDCGYDFARGETWSLNEMHSGIRRNVAGARDNMRLLLNALAAGGFGVPASKGVVWTIGVGQNTVNVSDYKPQIQEWLQDVPFWADMANDVQAWAQEAYADMRYWGVADTSRNVRTRNLSDYLEHFILLGENGPPAAQTAIDFLERTYMPLANDAWPQVTGSGFGNTAFSDDQMKRFVSEETFAVKHFSLSRPQLATDGRIAFAYAPPTGTPVCPNPDVPGTTKPCDQKTFAQLSAGILERLASSIHQAYEQGASSQAGACGPPGDHTWCSADIPNAAFNPLWATFPEWSAGG